MDRPVAVAHVAEAVPAVPPVATLVPTPIPPPAVTPEPAPSVERVKVSNTLGAGVNLRAKAGEKGQKMKTLAEGSVVEVIGADQTADGLIWRNVRDATGASGWMAGKFLAKVQP